MPSLSTTLRSVLTGAVVVLVLVVSSCGSSEATGEVTAVPPHEAVAMIGSGDYTVLDLRSEAAFEAGHVVGAVSLPLSAPDFEERLLTLDRNERYLVYARQDERTGEVADRMVAEGFATVVDAGAFGLLALAGAPVR